MKKWFGTSYKCSMVMKRSTLGASRARIPESTDAKKFMNAKDKHSNNLRKLKLKP